MKKYYLTIFFVFQAQLLLAAENSAQTSISKIESRESGLHDLYFTDPIPTEGCSLQDRAAISEIESPIGSKTMLSIAIAAMMSGKQVSIRVDGCVNTVNPRPKIVKVQIYK